MTDMLPTSINEIRQLTPKLNAATDSANKVVAAVEKFLNDEGAGIPARKLAWGDDLHRLHLEYARVNDKFRIAVSVEKAAHDSETGEYVRDEFGQIEYATESIRAWSECGRIEKLRTFPHLPDLLNAIASTIKDTIAATQRTSETVEAVLSALSAPKADSNAAPSLAAMQAMEEGAEEVQRRRHSAMTRQREITYEAQEAQRIRHLTADCQKANEEAERFRRIADLTKKF